ncbi:antitoxin [Streptomyces sp. NRRL F-5630]|uniref:antitoxin n=1 Tax=Streptomyces sp. NRRL F-5630 TaxID=1463864 RepID=UPI003EBC12D1
MGFIDNMRARLSPAKDKVADLARQHGDRIGDGLDKAAKTVDDRTKGKYSDRIQSGTDKAKGAVERMGKKDGEDGGRGRSGGSQQPPNSPRG